MSRPPAGTVTFLFTDIEGSTKRWQETPEAMKAALARHHALLQQAIELHLGSSDANRDARHRAIDAARRQLGAATADATWSDGATMTLEQALAYAREQVAPLVTT